MYKIIFTIFIICFSLIANAQSSSADKILGEWMSEEKDKKIEIYKSGSEYFGKLLWSSELYEADGKTSRKDEQNKDENLRDRDLLHVNLLLSFVYDSGIWDDGEMYDPQSGKTYHCIMRMRDQLLEIRSYIGFPLLGKSTYWNRATPQ